ncbi:Qb-SNARE 5 [Giardia muris]|uniref:Qb-SNARE 5 n=1 Tax=Giardia muris TaxID=5742 RepID=A0A4Z1SR96_GIAMU|nr:Qb-SNARE 5 [Giardia muris]|eukprot:TNJ28424.1 Qb-SNARE 5 [Giardia muris]
MTDEYDCILQDVQQALANYTGLRERAGDVGGAGEDAILELRKILDSAERDVRVLAREAKSTHDPGLLERRKGECDALQREIQEHRRQLAADLSAGAKDPEPEAPVTMTAEQRLGAAVVVQKDTNLKMDDAIHAMQETHELNEAILETLDRDLERLNRVSDELDGLAADTQLARRQLGNVLRSLSQNKCMLGIILVVAVIILIVSIVQIAKR